MAPAQQQTIKNVFVIKNVNLEHSRTFLVLPSNHQMAPFFFCFFFLLQPHSAVFLHLQRLNLLRISLAQLLNTLDQKLQLELRLLFFKSHCWLYFRPRKTQGLTARPKLKAKSRRFSWKLKVKSQKSGITEKLKAKEANVSYFSGVDWKPTESRHFSQKLKVKIEWSETTEKLKAKGKKNWVAKSKSLVVLARDWKLTKSWKLKAKRRRSERTEKPKVNFCPSMERFCARMKYEGCPKSFTQLLIHNLVQNDP